MRLGHELVAGKLLDDKTVEWLVLVKGLDHVVAITPGMGAGVVPLGVPFGISVAGDIQPVPAPTFTVMRRLKQLVDQSLVGLAGSIRQKRARHIGRGRQANQIKVGASQQGHPTGLGRERNPALPQPPQRKGVNRRSGAGAIAFRKGRNCRPSNRLKRPERAFLLTHAQTGTNILRLRPRGRSALLNPAFENVRLPGRDRLSARRHFPIADALKQEAALRIARRNCRSVLAASDHESPQAQIEPALHFRLGAMTIQAMLAQDGAHVFFERHSRRRRLTNGGDGGHRRRNHARQHSVESFTHWFQLSGIPDDAKSRLRGAGRRSALGGLTMSRASSGEPTLARQRLYSAARFEIVPTPTKMRRG